MSYWIPIVYSDNSFAFVRAFSEVPDIVRVVLHVC